MKLRHCHPMYCTEMLSMPKGQIPLRYLVRSWFKAGRRQVRSWFELSRHVEIARTCSKLVADMSSTSFEPDSVMEFGFKQVKVRKFWHLHDGAERHSDVRWWSSLPEEMCFKFPRVHAPTTSSYSVNSPTSPSITPSLFHSRLKTYLFHKFFPP